MTEQPFEYMDHRQRYLVTKVDNAAENLARSGRGNSGKAAGKPEKKYLLAQLLSITVADADFGDT